MIASGPTARKMDIKTESTYLEKSREQIFFQY